MTNHTSRLIIILCLAFTVAGCSKTGTQPAGVPTAASPQLAEDKHIASVDVVKTTVKPVEIVAGDSGEVAVRLSIQSGFHVNANPPTYSYLKATELEIAPGDGISADNTVYPKALNRKFAFAEKPLAVYEGETEVKVTLKSEKSAKHGPQSLAAKLRVQACDEAVCYAPGTLDLVIPVSIK